MVGENCRTIPTTIDKTRRFVIAIKGKSSQALPWLRLLLLDLLSGERRTCLREQLPEFGNFLLGREFFSGNKFIEAVFNPPQLYCIRLHQLRFRGRMRDVAR